MKNYVKNTLDKGEKIIVSSEVSKWSYAGPIGFGAFMFYLASLLINTGWGQIPAILIILFGLYVIVSAFISRWTTEYAVTNRKVLAKTGLISRKADELRISKVEGCDVLQGIQGRLLGYGTLIFSGMGTQKVQFEMVPDPLSIKKQVDRVIG
jgi:uncharacterized membrane protein YdbT with pleckstrin-like domain